MPLAELISLCRSTWSGAAFLEDRHQHADLPLALLWDCTQGPRWALSRASRSARLRSAHSARVPQNLLAARRLPVMTIFSHTRSSGFPVDVFGGAG